MDRVEAITVKQSSLFARIFLVMVCSTMLQSCSDDQTATTPKEHEQAKLVAPQVDPAAPRRYVVQSYEDLEKLFLKLDYTDQSWRSGSRAVPRVYLTNVPTSYRRVTSKQISVATRKRLFFRIMAPLLLRANELIIEDRQRVLSLQQLVIRNGRLGPEDRKRLDELAAAYRLKSPAAEHRIVGTLRELIRRVDVVPLSLALAQSAEESGWGTSRFTDQGNAFFGQWTFGEKRIRPREQRASKGNYGIAVFSSPSESAIAYMNNLNTHRAYTKFRALRAAQRARGRKPTGEALVAGLTRYSERGPNYVKTIKSIMRGNGLATVDNAYLADGPDIILVPVNFRLK